MSPERRAALFGWLVSLALHASVAGYLFYVAWVPDIGVEFALPDEVEFGLTEATTVREGAMPQATDPAPEDPVDDGEGEGDGEPEEEAAPDAGVRRDGGVDGGVDGGAPQVAEAGEEDGEGDGLAFLPAGSQIALRLDIGLMRQTPLAGEIRGLLALLPDWQQLLGASGVDPLEDLDRVLVATPNMNRSRLIIAGRARGGVESIRGATAAMAAAAGETAEWGRREGVPVAPWHDPSPVDRVIAIVGPRHFVICRPQDLRRVLSVAAARSDEDPDVHPADALMSMEQGEALSLEIEGFRNFVRMGDPGQFPTRLRIALSEAEGGAAFRGRGQYEDADSAEAGQRYLRSLAGLGRVVLRRFEAADMLLGRMEFGSQESEMTLEANFTMDEMSRMFSSTRELMEERAAPDEEPDPTEVEAPAPPPVPQPDERRPPPSPY